MNDYDIIEIDQWICDYRNDAYKGILDRQIGMGFDQHEWYQDHDRTDEMQIEVVAAESQDRIIETDKAQGKDEDHRGTDRCWIVKQGHPAVIGESLIDQAIDRKRYQHDRNDKTVAAGDDREISE